MRNHPPLQYHHGIMVTLNSSCNIPNYFPFIDILIIFAFLAFFMRIMHHFPALLTHFLFFSSTLFALSQVFFILSLPFLIPMLPEGPHIQPYQWLPVCVCKNRSHRAVCDYPIIPIHYTTNPPTHLSLAILSILSPALLRESFP